MTPETAKKYKAYTRSMRRQMSARRWEDDAEGFMKELERRRPNIRPRTLRLYRRSIIFTLEDEGRIEEAGRLRGLFDNMGKAGKKRRQLVRRVPDEIYEKLLIELDERGTKIARDVANLVIAIAVCGLRPKEWEAAIRFDRILHVTNAKFSEGEHGRGNGRERVLELTDEVTDREIVAIDSTIDLFHRSPYLSIQPNMHVAFKETLAKTLGKYGISRWYQRLRIYDFRHQFSADAKASWGVEDGRVATAMGHASGETAVTHYGRRRAGRNGAVKVQPNEASISAVRKLYTPKQRPVRTPTVTPAPDRSHEP